MPALEMKLLRGVDLVRTLSTGNSSVQPIPMVPADVGAVGEKDVAFVGEFLGRADHQVKVGAARVELGEIEARLMQQHSSG